jgi:methionine biosynthesis protein MetW
MRYDHYLISKLIKPGSKVMDLGCGDGELLYLLKRDGITGRGIDIDEDQVLSCVEKGISVVQSNLDKGLKDYKDNSFDYVILNDTLQTVTNPANVLKEAVRVGKKVIVTFPNFAHYSVRLKLLVSGRMPKSKSLPYEWYNTPNIHLFTIKDFKDLCEHNHINILLTLYYNRKNGKGTRTITHPNLLAKNALFLIDTKPRMFHLFGLKIVKT